MNTESTYVTENVIEHFQRFAESRDLTSAAWEEDRAQQQTHLNSGPLNQLLKNLPVNNDWLQGYKCGQRDTINTIMGLIILLQALVLLRLWTR